MKTFKLFSLAVLASLTLISCSKEKGITVTNEVGQSVTSFEANANGSTSSDYTVKTIDGSDWTVSVSGIEGMYADPDHGKTNFYFCIVVPKNTGAARTGKVIVYGGNTKHEITVNQKGE